MKETLNKIINKIEKSPRFMRNLHLVNGILGTGAGLYGLGYAASQLFNGEVGESIFTGSVSFYILTRGISNAGDYIELTRKKQG